jgi:ankyrin repeat protein
MTTRRATPRIPFELPPLDLQERLCTAARNGQVENVWALVKEGADVLQRDAKGFAALGYADNSGNVGTVLVIMELTLLEPNNVSPHYVPWSALRSIAPLFQHQTQGPTELEKMLTETMGIHTRYTDRVGTGTPLHIAAYLGDVKTVRLLVKMGGNVRAQGADRGTPLHLAAAKGHAEIVSLLVKMGGDVQARDVHENTPLHFAAERGQTEAVRVLVENGANVLAHAGEGGTPLHCAAGAGHAETVRVLVEMGTDVHAPSANGLTPLHFATAGGHTETVRVLVEKGGDLHARSVDPAAQAAAEVADVRRVGESSVACEVGTLHSGLEQPTTRQAECRLHKERERKGKQRQRKRTTTRATLEEALAQMNTAGASLDTLNVLDAAIVSAKRILEHGGASSSTDALVVSSCTIIDLPELLRQAEEKALNSRREVHAMAKAASVDLFEEGLVRLAVAESSAHMQEQQQNRVEPPPSATLLSAIALAENGNTCVVCLAAPKDSVVLPCKHLAMCAECTRAVFTSSSRPQCPVCRSRIADCIYSLFM